MDQHKNEHEETVNEHEKIVPEVVPPQQENHKGDKIVEQPHILPDPFELIRESYSQYRKYFSRMFPVLTLVYITSALTIFSRYAHNPLLAGIISLIAGIISLVSYVALIRIICDVQTDAHDITGNFKQSLRLFWPYIWVVLLTVAVIAGATIAFIIPGIIISLYLILSVFLFIVEDKRGLDALVGSWEYVHKRWWQIAWRMIVYLIFIGCVSLIIIIIFSLFGIRNDTAAEGNPIGVDLIQQIVQAFIFLPFSIIYSYRLYLILKNSPVVSPTEEKRVQVKRWFKILAIAGTIILPILFIGAIIFALFN